MAGIFSYESKFSKIMFRFAYGCYLNLLWAICSLPIITAGASTTALYDVAMRIAEDREGDLTQQFFRAFRTNFRQATTLWLILLAAGIFLGTDIYVLLHLRAAATGTSAVFWTLILAVVIVACIAYAIELMYVFPLVARVENTNRAMLVNSLLIGTHYLNCTLVVFAIHFLMAVIAIRFFTPILLLGEGLCAVLSSYLLSPVIRACATPPSEGSGQDPQED
ncbi:MAG: YesL family protein [Atopobiaceae bacterium]|nr:YesL family protein [Atopobiaceae bacterium]